MQTGQPSSIVQKSKAEQYLFLAGALGKKPYPIKMPLFAH